MANKRYVLKLTAEERQELERLTRRGVTAAGKVARARALLLCDAGESGPAWTDEAVAKALGVTVRSLESWRKRACEEGPLESLERRKRTSAYPTKLDGDGEARLVKLACSAPPRGRGRWTLRLLAARLVELEVVDVISRETVRQVLKKTR